MNAFPFSIESHLSEAGFSPTELVVVRKLYEDDAMTLRQMAAKTGKSTGVLDQATKKLLKRNIVIKEHRNGTTVYRLISMHAITRWVAEDTRQKQEMLKRRFQNFEAFISTLPAGDERPELEYFDGEEGMKKAYEKLLGYGKEMLHYFPVVCAVEDDPLRDFRVEYFRQRRRKGIFSRTIVHNTPLGRRFASRDPFEYRKTQLVPEDTYPITFEKVIVGDVVACINHTEKKAYLIRLPEMAETERQIFERIWREQEDAVGPPHSSATAQKPAVPLATRTLSGLREFFLSKKSLVLFGVFALIAAGITYGLYCQNVSLNTQRIRERAMSIAATGAMQFDAKDLDQLRTIDDIKKPEYAKVIKLLNDIRSKNDGVRFAYIFRPTSQKGYWEFVADADSMDPNQRKDLNGDGVIDEQDALSVPGEKYEVFDPDFEIALKNTFSAKKFQQDQWGTFLSASAPIRDDLGNTVALFGIDIQVDQISALSRETFNAILYFFGFFFLFVFIRLIAFNKSLFDELWQVFKMRKVLIMLALIAEISFFITLGLYYYTLNIIKDELGQKLMAITSTAASQFDPADLDQLHLPRDMKTEAYQRVFKKLNEIRDNNDGVKWTYIFRSLDGASSWEFVADIGSNYNVPYWEDYNKDGIQTPDELNVAPGTYYFSGESILSHKDLVLRRPSVDHIYTDQWGTYLSAYAPIGDPGRANMVLGVDMSVAEVYTAAKNRFEGTLWFMGVFALLSLSAFVTQRIRQR